MTESSKNIRFVCSEHAPRPNPRFAAQPRESFLGKHVKLGFEGRRFDNGKLTVEHLWVVVKGLCGDAELVGEIDNDPITKMDYACGDLVTFKTSEIEAVYGE